MRAFTESRALLGDPAALRDRMAADGYLFFRRLLPPAAVAAVRGRMLAVLAEAGWLSPDRPAEAAIPAPGRFAVEPEPAYLDVMRRQFAIEELHALQHRPELLELATALFDAPTLPLPLPLFVCRNIFPDRDAFTTPAHQDFVHIQGSRRNHAAWVPLGDCPAEMGGVAVAAGSHRDGLRAFRPALGAGGLEVEDAGDLDWRAGPFETGDVLLHSCLTVHKGLPNRSGRMRLSVDFRYQPVAEPMCANNVEPLRRIATWDALYRGWRNDALQYYWRRHDLQIVPFDMQYFAIRDRLAFEMAERGDARARSALQRCALNDPDPDMRSRAAVLLQRLDGVAADA